MIDIRNVAKFYKGLDHQVKALGILQDSLIDHIPELLQDDADWVKLWRTSPLISNGLLPNFNGGDMQETITAICTECDRQGLPLTNQKAYVLATVEWETASTFLSVREAYWLSEEWRRQNLRYYPYYGRGYVQITWKENYQKYADILNLPLVDNPDLVMEPQISLFILVHGCKHGTFTGMRIEDYITQHGTDFWNARRVINGTDKAQEIKEIAQKWARILAK